MLLANFANTNCTDMIFGFHYLKGMKYNVLLYNNEEPVIYLNSNEMNFKYSENHSCHMIPVIKVLNTVLTSISQGMWKFCLLTRHWWKGNRRCSCLPFMFPTSTNKNHVQNDVWKGNKKNVHHNGVFSVFMANLINVYDWPFARILWKIWRVNWAGSLRTSLLV